MRAISACAFVLCAFVLVSSCLAAPLVGPPPVVRYENDADSYSFAFETSDGTTRQEQGELQNTGTEQEAISVKGSASWVAPDGQTFTLNYIADENGYQPQGDFLPHN